MISRSIQFTRKFPIDARLAKYALAGSAFLACSGTAKADIVYSGLVNLLVNPGTPLQVDFDGAGGNDFSLNVFADPGDNEIWVEGAPNTRFNIGPLSYGAPITVGNTTSSGYNDLFKDGYTYPWQNTSHGYLGVRFTTSGQQYLGWAELTLDGANPSATLNSYAYNDTPLGSIYAGQVPEPGSMSLFAAGAAGLAILRRRRKSTL